jgi:hypothetical protein
LTPRLLVTASLVLATALAGAAPAGAAMFVGAAEDSAKHHDPVEAAARMELAGLAGLEAIRLSSTWSPGRRVPTGADLVLLQNAVLGAQVNGIRVVLAVYPYGSRATPRTPRARAQFAAYTASLVRALPGVTDVIVGNEPNLNRFWMPQFTKKGSSAAPAAYVQLLATTYDALKRVSPDVNVIGGAVSPRGGDRPRSSRHTHSPTRFILEMGRAYRASKRKRPLMDTFAIHPYQIPSRVSPAKRHPRSTTIAIADYGKLVRLLGRAFDGTPQRGSRLPILYAEFGVQSTIPKEKQEHYANLNAPAARDSVSEAQQAAYYRRAFALAQCQPNVVGMLVFHVSDESDARAWQSGLYYADHTPKSSLPVVRDAALRAREGRLVRCKSGKRFRPLGGVRFPDTSTVETTNERWTLDLVCRSACRYDARIVAVPTATGAFARRLVRPTTVLAARGTVAGKRIRSIALPARPLEPGSYRFKVRVFTVGRPGTAVVRYSDVFAVEPPAPPQPAPPEE